MGILRALWRSFVITGMVAAALGEAALQSDKSLRGRALWMQRWSRRSLRAAGVQVHVAGRPPQDGLLVSNHISYLDVMVLGAAAPSVFVSKAEIRSWPIAGALARMAGTIFLDRESRMATSSVTAQMEARIEAKLPVVMFPEGTTTDGSHVLPFRSSLFEAPVSLGAAIHVACLRYAVPEDAPEEQSVRNKVAYWGEMNFLTHLPRLLMVKRIEAMVEFSPDTIRTGNRKDAAAEAEKLVRTMFERA